MAFLFLKIYVPYLRNELRIVVGLKPLTKSIYATKYDSKLKLDYINIPIIAKYYLIDNFKP